MNYLHAAGVPCNNCSIIGHVHRPTVCHSFHKKYSLILDFSNWSL